MKKLFLLPALCLILSFSFSQVTRCDWREIGKPGEPQLSDEFQNDLGFPLQYLITKCDCYCQKQVTMTGQIKYVGPQSFSVFFHLFTMSDYDPFKTYWGQAYCSISTSDWRNCFVSINNSGQVFLTVQDRPIEPGALIRITFTFNIL